MKNVTFEYEYEYEYLCNVFNVKYLCKSTRRVLVLCFHVRRIVCPVPIESPRNTGVLLSFACLLAYTYENFFLESNTQSLKGVIAGLGKKPAHAAPEGLRNYGKPKFPGFLMVYGESKTVCSEDCEEPVNCSTPFCARDLFVFE